jgi:hypothetical protein
MTFGTSYAAEASERLSIHPGRTCGFAAEISVSLTDPKLRRATDSTWRRAERRRLSCRLARSRRALGLSPYIAKVRVHRLAWTGMTTCATERGQGGVMSDEHTHSPEPESSGLAGYAAIKYSAIVIIVLAILAFIAWYVIPAFNN